MRFDSTSAQAEVNCPIAALGFTSSVTGHSDKLSAARARAISSEKIQENGAIFEYHGPRGSLEWQSRHDLLKIVSTEAGTARLASIAWVEKTGEASACSTGAVRISITVRIPSAAANGSRRIVLTPVLTPSKNITL